MFGLTKKTQALIVFGLLALAFAVLPLLWHAVNAKPGPRPLMGVVTEITAETFTLEMRNGKQMTLFYGPNLSPDERATVALGAALMVEVDPVVDGRPEAERIKVRPPKP